eukprot:CAMPEP_0179476516 /NCGR_PEP_ID=MMETSP0799-20121207/55540_1 /TAXON_ID=46947 /ORGANISM="Geminigera cryophila, Strain CCMP2564" /LENGTH=88 /DNA_ID=CAMNT_0021286793 /DNA_START=255 /DNA_END=518 /DNA_ORIENTATION=+
MADYGDGAHMATHDNHFSAATHGYYLASLQRRLNIPQCFYFQRSARSDRRAIPLPPAHATFIVLVAAEGEEEQPSVLGDDIKAFLRKH